MCGRGDTLWRLFECLDISDVGLKDLRGVGLERRGHSPQQVRALRMRQLGQRACGTARLLGLHVGGRLAREGAHSLRLPNKTRAELLAGHNASDRVLRVARGDDHRAASALGRRERRLHLGLHAAAAPRRLVSKAHLGGSGKER